jgi:hypothetical protein
MMHEYSHTCINITPQASARPSRTALITSLLRLNRYTEASLRPMRGGPGPGNRGAAVEGATCIAEFQGYGSLATICTAHIGGRLHDSRH